MMKNTFKSYTANRNVNLLNSDAGHVGIALPVYCTKCIAWQRLALEEVLTVCIQNSATLHIEVDTEMAVELHDALRRWGGEVCGYSSAKSIDEFSKWRRSSQIHLVKHFAQIIFTGNAPTARDEELYSSVSALTIMDCDHIPFRSIVGVLPKDIVVGIVSRRFTSTMMRAYEVEGNIVSNRIMVDSNAKRLTQRLCRAL